MPEPTTPLADRPWEDVGRMVDVELALAQVLAAFTPLPTEEVTLLKAMGRVLVSDVVARDSVPPFRNSAMDGFAVRAEDTKLATWDVPVELPVVAHVAAGQREIPSLAAGQAIRIMTGAPMPAGADAVVRFEETDEPQMPGNEPRQRVRVFHAAKHHDNVREAGEDIAAGAVVARRGEQLDAPKLGLIASVGGTRVAVHRRPVVGVVSTGNELVGSGRALTPGSIRDSNAIVIGAMAQAWGADLHMLGIARDTVNDLKERFGEARDLGVDLIVTSGGVSLGDYDFVKDVLRTAGEVSIWQVRMKPGKPLAFGLISGTPLLGLPGNPVAAAVSFILFGRPALRRMLGHREVEPRTISAETVHAIDNRGHRRHFVRVCLEARAEGPPLARVVGDQGAGILSSLAAADALLIVPEELEKVAAGTRLQAIPLTW